MKKLTDYIHAKMLNEALENVILEHPNIPESTIRHYYNHALDDSDKSDRMLHFVLKLHKNNSISPEMSDYIKPHMGVVARANLKNRLSSINSLDELQVLTEPHMHLQKAKKMQIDSDMPIDLDTPNITVRHIKNQKAAIKAAILPNDNRFKSQISKAKWCVSIDDALGEGNGVSYYNHYTNNNKVPMYTIEDKKGNRLHAVIHDTSRPMSEIQYRDEYDRTIAEEGQHPNEDNLHEYPKLYANLLKKYPELVEHQIGKDLLSRPIIKLYHSPNVTHYDVMDLFHEKINNMKGSDKMEMAGIVNHPEFDMDASDITSLPRTHLGRVLSVIRNEKVANKLLSNDHVLHTAAPSHVAELLSKVAIPSDTLHKVFDISKKHYEVEDDVYGMKRIANGVLSNQNANENHIDKALDFLNDSDMRIDDDTLNKLISNTHLNQDHLNKLHKIMFNSSSDSQKIFYNLPNLPKHVLLNHMERNSTISYKVNRPIPREIALEVLKSPNSYCHGAIVDSITSPYINFDEAKHMMNVGSHFNSVLYRKDVPQHVIDDIMSKDANAPLTPGYNNYAAQMALLNNEEINHKIKKEHLQAIIDSQEPHNAFFAENVLNGKTAFGGSK